MAVWFTHVAFPRQMSSTMQIWNPHAYSTTKKNNAKLLVTVTCKHKGNKLNDSQEKWDKLEVVNYSHENEKMSTFYILTDTACMKGNHCLYSIGLKQMLHASKFTANNSLQWIPRRWEAELKCKTACKMISDAESKQTRNAIFFPHPTNPYPWQYPSRSFAQSRSRASDRCMVFKWALWLSASWFLLHEHFVTQFLGTMHCNS